MWSKRKSSDRALEQVPRGVHGETILQDAEAALAACNGIPWPSTWPQRHDGKTLQLMFKADWLRERRRLAALPFSPSYFPQAMARFDGRKDPLAGDSPESDSARPVSPSSSRQAVTSPHSEPPQSDDLDMLHPDSDAILDLLDELEDSTASVENGADMMTCYEETRPKDLIECVGNSSNQFVANLFRKDPKFAEAFAKEEVCACGLPGFDMKRVANKITKSYLMDPYSMLMHYKRAFKLMKHMKANHAKVLILGNKNQFGIDWKGRFEGMDFDTGVVDEKTISSAPKHYDMILCLDPVLYCRSLHRINVPVMMCATPREIAEHPEILNVTDYLLPSPTRRHDAALREITATAEIGNGVKEDQPKGGKKKKYTVSSEFKEQLSSLMDVVDLTEPHFIRCIKPNPQNLPDLFDRKGVTEQLRYGGVLQVVQVSRAGYPVRINHQECWDDYKVVGLPKVISELRHLQDPKIRAQKLLEHLDAELNIPKPKHGQSWAVGKTLVFFKLPAYERVKFARQQSEEASKVEDQIALCSTMARELADNILQVQRTSADLMEAIGATEAQVCFFTLVLRHTQNLDDVRTAQRLLDELSSTHLDVVDAFRRRNAEVLVQLESEAYVREALESHTPWKASCDGSRPSGQFATVCLASACLDTCGSVSPNCLAWASRSDCWDELVSHPLCQELLRELKRRSLMTPESHVLLSYSGGVDSTAHLLLLLALKRRFQMPHISCLMLSYPNRQAEEVEAEQLWAAWVCHHLGVELFMYEVCLARPHADVHGTCGLSREDYERSTKEIRYKMYRALLSNSEKSVVVLGHHQDDVDENRLDHLMKGHVLGDVEGMWAWRQIHGVQLSRPLIHKRKSDFLGLLQAFPTPFFRDSTPLWSVRGATRAALDSLQPDVRDFLVLRLQSFAQVSLEVGNLLDQAVDTWAEGHVQVLQLPRRACGLALDLDALFSLEVGNRLADVESILSEITQLWNPLVPKSAGRESGEDQTEGPKGSSSISTIPDNPFDVPALLFERGFFAAARDLVSKRLGHFHSSEISSVNRKAVHHLFANIRNCTKPHFSGGLSQELGYLHVAGPRQVLVLYDVSAHPEVDFKTLRTNMLRSVMTAFGGDENIETLGLELLIKSTTLIQASWRGKVRRRMFVAIRLFTRHVQALLRSKQARTDLQRRRSEDCATKLQAHARAKLVADWDPEDAAE
ncbi:Unconventional myosin-X [Symbiodinium microadriaticum]|uniref:Unconventional myosin-X n=1 Tax=Symbiodinium microadriaticum TaxID=2951 RepID=A0A1Q9ET14_SYMMI|nr:Unconventional myosin-X [Symbiodinium microadriaticum]